MRTHTDTTHTQTLPADVWRMLFFLRGMRWAVGGGGGVVSERSRWWQTSSTCERGEMTECRDERRWHWLGRGVRVAGPLFYSLVITGEGGFVAGTHILACARIHITQSDRQLFITRLGGRPTSRNATRVLMKVTRWDFQSRNGSRSK